jgi:DNA topoisomerase VI subunit B
MADGTPRLVRETFRTSRLIEFCSERELVAQIGHHVQDWPLVILKELVDNAIDIAEEIGVAPKAAIEVSTERGEIIITDNGPGIPTETIKDILDPTVRVSSREAYVSPTRGAQGNALKTIVAMPFALDGSAGETLIEAGGVTHRILFKVDPIRQEPRVTCDPGPSSVKNGTRVTVRWPAKASRLLTVASDRFLPLVWNFVALNPHLAVTLDWDGERLVNWEPTNPAWEKWKPFDPTPAHWYTPDRFQRLIAASVQRDLDHDRRVRSVRDFIADFRGLSGTAKRSAILVETNLAARHLDIFFAGDQVDHNGIARLLAAMQEHSRPVRPEALGLIGEEHFRDNVFAVDEADDTRFKYCRVLGEDQGIPFIVEAAFAPADEMSLTPLVAGINWSAAINDPFRSLGTGWRNNLSNVLIGQHVHLAVHPVLVGVHVASPTVQFTDRGKATAALENKAGDAVIEAVRRVTKEWAATFEKRQRQHYRQKRSIERQGEQQAKDARAKAKRERAVTVGTGVLYQEIAAAAEAEGVSIRSLTVLSPGHDPYLRDTTDGHRDGKWFADQVARFIAPDKQIHLRGLFYRIVGAGDVRRPGGPLVVNSEPDWNWFQKYPAKSARWLGYVGYDRIRDERNEPPRLISYATSPSSGFGHLTAAIGGIELPQVDDLLPHVARIIPVVPQPYRIIMIGEKSSLGEVLEPIAQQVKGELILLSGEISDTLIAEMAARAAADPRPSVVLYFSDFDPSGHQMPHSVSRKLQAQRRHHHAELQIEVHRVALTIDQVRALGLPSTPLKGTEKRAKKWRAVMRHEQTEIDALAALHPDELRRIALEALAPFYDFTLDERCAAAGREWRIEAEKRLADHPALAAAEQKIRAAYANVRRTIAALYRAQRAALARLSGIGSVVIPAPEVQITAAAPAPLFTTKDDFVTATRKLIVSRALEDSED